MSELTVPKAASEGMSQEVSFEAKAGLVSELSRQTYDALYKSIRECVLNSIDAGATEVVVDFSKVQTDNELSVLDNGTGMSHQEFRDNFMSLGGSSKYGTQHKFGRIGIGSLALLQYGKSAQVITRRSGDPRVVVATLQNPWLSMNVTDRQVRLDQVTAGKIELRPHEGIEGDHFTKIVVSDLVDAAIEVCSSPSNFFALVETLERVMPLTWGESRIRDSLRQTDPDLASDLESIMAEWSVPLAIISPWQERLSLSRRSFGDDASGRESWSGTIHPIHKTLRVRDGDSSRRIVLMGYLINQEKAVTSWSGITARVQNVAVEECTFFDVTADPGFRKYITGEIHVTGQVDRERLINIDRASFNRESPDYQVIQRYLSREIQQFKSEKVQRQRQDKVKTRSVLKRRAIEMESLERAASAIETVLDLECGISGSSKGLVGDEVSIVDEISDTVDAIGVDPDGKMNFVMESLEGSEGLSVTVGESLYRPTVRIGGVEYRVVFVDACEDDAPVSILDRPPRIEFNKNHPSNGSQANRRWDMVLLVEIIVGREPSSGGCRSNLISALGQI